ncbi:uncharacterized protein LOC108212431 [Daucus carota subsp. sativus]|uniref:uncharacterized protein LOC108212431 n=1 Tax=Daucus carota subsp. sativus TaxID=79200 RepID=UPI003082E643
MKPPKTQKEVQKLAGSLAALRRFISKLAEKSLPFFELLKGAKNKKEVDWNPDCQKAFEEIKKYLAKPPILTKAQPGKPLYLYLSAGTQAIGAALIREESGQQKPVYYVSQVLKDSETRYPNLEKFAFALITASRKLRHYFQGREIRIVTDQPLRRIIHKPDISGRLVNWAIELSQFNLTFIPRTAIKAQILADFVTECNFPEEVQNPKSRDQKDNHDPLSDSWILHVDGSSTTERSGAGLILKSPSGFTIRTAISFKFTATNNQAEYEALLAGLKLAKTLGIQSLKIYGDSQIVVRQTRKEYLAKDPVLTKYQTLVQSYLATIPHHQILQVNREENTEADILSKLVQNSSDLDSSVYFEELQRPATEYEEILEINNEPNWMTPLINYLEKGELPEDKGKAQRLKAKAAKFFIEEGSLFRRTYSSPILKCVGPEEAEYCLREVHEGICGDHMSAKALAYKIIRQGYYWPTIHQEAIDFVKKCRNCQLFSNVARVSPVLQSSVLSPIPFVVWGIDIMGPFPRAKGDLRYLLVSIDYMTKWVEAKAMRTINQRDCIRFMDNILMRFGIPRVLVSDNGPQFIGSVFENYLKERGIKHKKSSVAYPQGNGQVEVTNRILLRGIEKRLQESKDKWPEELPNVLWAYRTSPRTSTGETPFKLAYGTEAMLPIEVGSPSHRVINFDEIANEEGLRTNLDLIDEIRDQAIQRMEKYKEKTREHFSKKSRVKNFHAGDLVLRDTEASDPTNTGKLMPKWEGPYKVKEVIRPGTYKLENMDDSEVPNTWHGLRLRKYYQ